MFSHGRNIPAPNNEFRLAVAALSGGLLPTIYAQEAESVRQDFLKQIRNFLFFGSI